MTISHYAQSESMQRLSVDYHSMSLPLFYFQNAYKMYIGSLEANITVELFSVRKHGVALGSYYVYIMDINNNSFSGLFNSSILPNSLLFYHNKTGV